MAGNALRLVISIHIGRFRPISRQGRAILRLRPMPDVNRVLSLPFAVDRELSRYKCLNEDQARLLAWRTLRFRCMKGLLVLAETS